MTRFLVLLGALCVGIGSGWLSRGWMADAQIAALQKDYADAARKGSERAKEKAEALAVALQQKEDLAAELAALEDTARRVVTREVIKYVSSPDSGRCVVPDDGVRLHDLAATGGLSGDAEAPGGADGSARQITDRELIPLVVDNYGECNKWRARLIGLQSWVKAASNSGSEVAKPSQ